jgi:hypothetical protein
MKPSRAERAILTVSDIGKLVLALNKAGRSGTRARQPARVVRESRPDTTGRDSGRQ